MLLIQLTDGYEPRERRIVNQAELDRLNLVAACCTAGNWWWEIISTLD